MPCKRTGDQIHAHLLQSIRSRSEWCPVLLLVGNYFAAKLFGNLKPVARDGEHGTGRNARICLGRKRQPGIGAAPGVRERQHSNVIADRLRRVIPVDGIVRRVSFVNMNSAHAAHVGRGNLLQIREPNDGFEHRAVLVRPAVGIAFKVGDAVRGGKDLGWRNDCGTAKIEELPICWRTQAQRHLPRPISRVGQQAADDLRAANALPGPRAVLRTKGSCLKQKKAARHLSRYSPRNMATHDFPPLSTCHQGRLV